MRIQEAGIRMQDAVGKMNKVPGPSQAIPICRDCQRYDAERKYCRKNQWPVGETSGCSDFRMKLADHYAPSPWSKWKEEAERKESAKKVKSS
jgi:hypothetical protein